MITREMLVRYTDLMKRKKELDDELSGLKSKFTNYFDQTVGEEQKGELIVHDFKLQRQIRTAEKYEQESTVEKLETLNLNNLIVKSPDEAKIKSAIELGILTDEDLQDCKTVKKTQAIYVKQTL
jgi:hypothetical protein